MRSGFYSDGLHEDRQDGPSRLSTDRTKTSCCYLTTNDSSLSMCAESLFLFYRWKESPVSGRFHVSQGTFSGQRRVEEKTRAFLLVARTQKRTRRNIECNNKRIKIIDGCNQGEFAVVEEE